MLSTELENIKFDDKQKQLVMENIKSHKKQSILKHIINPKKQSPSWLPKVTSVIFSLALIMIMFSPGKHFLFNENNATYGNKEKIGEQETITHSDSVDSENFSKNEILYRMLNTNDYFKTAQGVYVYKTPFTENKIFYKARMEKGNISGYEKAVNKQTNEAIITIVNNNKLLTLYEEQKEYVLSEISLNEEAISLEEVFREDAHNQVINYRDRPPIAIDSLFPFEIASNYLQDLTHWDIENQEEKFLEENVIVIKGELDEINSEKYQSVSFRLWVHKSSGILMKMETYNAEGKIVDSLITQEFAFNKPIPSSEFKMNIPEDLKKITHF